MSCMMTTCLCCIQTTDNKGTDQHAHLPYLISTLSLLFKAQGVLVVVAKAVVC